MIALVTLPLTTRILGPRDYGLLALGTTLAGVGGVFGTLGTGFLVGSRWPQAGRDERRALATTIVFTGTAVALAWTALFAIVYGALHDRIGLLEELPASGLALVLVGTVLSPAWIVATEVLTVEGRAAFFSAMAVVQALATAVVTLVSLFWFDAGVLSLFLGIFAASLAGFAAGLVVLRPYLGGRYDREARRALSQLQFLRVQLLDSAQGFLERILLARFAGFHDLGLYTHSQRYYGMAHAATKAVARGVWPASLTEARETAGGFPATGRTWRPVHIAVTAGAIALTLLGDFVIAWLTNDKFTDAAWYLAPWFTLLLLQLSAKPEVATAYACAPGSSVARMSFHANMVAVASTIVLVPLFGAAGALAALLLQALTYRIVVRFAARRYRRIPFQDEWALFGIALIAVAFLLKLAARDDVLQSVGALAALEAACLLASFRILRSTLRGLFRTGAPAAGS